ncbi:MAG: hypothetical protein KDC39_14285 [Actinobacteria bacterium]|nr:hypothetical protein [Actinomycetota bacterium]
MEPQSTRYIEKEFGAWLDWLFRDSRGRVVIAQFPNTPLWFAFGFLALRLVLSPSGTLATVLTLGFAVALAWWAIDEIVRGVNPFRRILGVSALFFVVVSLLGVLA